jgi:hypothetical protein
MIINETLVVSFFIVANADDEGKVDDLPQLQRRQPPPLQARQAPVLLQERGARVDPQGKEDRL